ncbi:MBOAT family O-acyltransferase [Desulfatiglans anilini]|uniref:MBOAT family O-acyltransferase n=1 Tax=Desulfatiglans anilini TaxID=90728 RepID=UPI0003F54C8D|nr:MBOAT family protein [Desulfatiglans anilini]
MVFSSIIFLFCFLPVTLGIYFLLGRRGQNAWLLLASLVFYAWGEVFYVAVMLASIAANYAVGVLIAAFRGGRWARLILGIGIAADLAILVFFKYSAFLAENLSFLMSPILGRTAAGIDPGHLPLGISFFTFQSMSYIIDVYRGAAPAQRNPMNIGLYIALFPQLIAGPIVRYHDLARQIVSRRVRLADFAAGVERFVFGLGKKVLIANNAGAIADPIFAVSTGDLTAPVAWLGIVCYTIQIYFDFSGYSDMAIGLGRMFGFRFLENFNYPYVSRSMRGFWRRWHISLSTWFRDYLYIPLGGSRKGPLRTYANLATVFFLVGLWHGASWNFVVWGLFHGTFLVLERLGFGSVLERCWRPIRHGYVLAVVMSGWVFFRAETLSGALGYLEAMMGLTAGDALRYPLEAYLDRQAWGVVLCGAVFATPVFPAVRGWMQRLGENAGGVAGVMPRCAAAVLENAAFVLLLAGSILYLAAGSYNPFIYFRF